MDFVTINNSRASVEFKVANAVPFVHDEYVYVEVKFPTSTDVRDYQVYNAINKIAPSYKHCLQRFSIDNTTFLRFVAE